MREYIEGVLEKSWRTHGEAGYSCPSGTTYPWQWYWDSCFHALIWNELGSNRGKLELASLLDAQREDGHIGHTIFWEQGPGIRYPWYNLQSYDEKMTETIQPPLLGWVARLIGLDTAYDSAIHQHHAFLDQHRTLGDSPLLWIIQADESGLDASPKFDEVWPGKIGGQPGFPLLVRRNRTLGFDLEKVHQRGYPVVCETLVNTLYSLSRQAMGETSLTQAMCDELWDEHTGLFFDRSLPDRDTHVSTCASLAPLALPDLPETIARRIIEEHVLDPSKYWTPLPIPSVSLKEPSFTLNDRNLHVLRRYWRGPTWINTSWLVWIGLVRWGYLAQAKYMADQLESAIRTYGLREYYHPITGFGMGALGFGWSGISLCMQNLASHPDTVLS